MGFMKDLLDPIKLLKPYRQSWSRGFRELNVFPYDPGLIPTTYIAAHSHRLTSVSGV